MSHSVQHCSQLIGGLVSRALIHVKLNGDKAEEAERFSAWNAALRENAAGRESAFVDLDAEVMNWIGPLVLAVKMVLIAFLIVWFRITYPRFREDQLQRLAWKFLIPLALINITVTGLLKVVL